MKRVLDYTEASAQPGSPPGRDAARLEHLLAGYQMYLGHDLANQLVAIQGFARHLQETATTLDADSTHLLARLVELTRRADRHARRLAEIGRLTRAPAYGEPVSLLEIALEAVACVKAVPRTGGEGRRDRTRFTVAEPMPVVRVNGKLLVQVLVELLHDAVAAMPADRPGRVSIEARSEGDACLLLVRDDGRGFTEAQLARLGETGNPSPASHVQALGYFLVRQAVAHWRGRLTIESEPDRGTSVVLALPHARCEGRPSGEGHATP